MGIRIANFLITLTNIALSIITFFIGVRIILRFISANPSTPIVSWIYSISSSMISPFRGIVPDFQTGTGILDLVALFAFVGYVVAGYLLIELFRKVGVASDTEVATAHYHEVDEDLDDDEEEKVIRRRTHHSR